MRRPLRKTALGSILFAGAVLAVAVTVEPQPQKKIPRIGYLGLDSRTNTFRADAFRQGLRQLGYAEGKDLVIESRSADGKLDRLNELATELVRLKVDVIVTRGPVPTGAAKAATATIPIVMTQDPRSGGQRIRRQSSAARRKHHWIIKPCPGDKRQATGAAERDCSETLPCSRSKKFDYSRPSIRVKRDRTCGRSIGCAASIS